MENHENNILESQKSHGNERERHNCCVPQCFNVKTVDNHLHRAPKDVVRRRQWEIVVKTGKPLTERMTVCSEHFKESDYIPSGATMKKRLKNTAVPSSKLPLRSQEKPMTSPVKRKKEERADRARKRMSRAKEMPFTGDSVDAEEDENLARVSDVSYASEGEVEESCFGEGDKGRFDDSEKATFKDIGIQTDSKSAIISSILSSDQKLYTCTGIHSIDLLNSLVESIDKIAPSSIYGPFSMCTRDRMILSMMKVKLTLSFSALAAIFDITIQNCNYFYDSVVVLSKVLRYMIFWPSKDDILKNMPRCFSGFTSTRAVLDCFEVNIERAKCLRCRVRSYSFYKKNHTCKILVICTPSGFISDVVCAFGGRASDKTVTDYSGIYQKCDYGDALMVDKGFDMDDSCLQNFVKLHRPSFLRQKKKISTGESVHGAKIARARVHVERVIERIREYLILKDRIPWTMCPYVDNIVIIVSALVKLGPPVLAKDKY